MVISVQNLQKNFSIKRETGKGLFFKKHKKETLEAVKSINFDIARGETVAFIGPNGAGKSTTLKMLSGIMFPTSGSATVSGLIPWENRKKLAYKIGLVFGQRSQLWAHLPASKSFELIAQIYSVEETTYQKQIGLLTEMFQLQKILNQPVKSLSLGQRMRCEIAASLIHAPSILFLDEPTIGLDVTMKSELRDHLCTLNKAEDLTIILTSHDTDDIEKVCKRVILINHGEKLIDTPLSDMKKQYLNKKLLAFATEEETPTIDIPQALSITQEPYKLLIEINPELTPVSKVMHDVLEKFIVHDISVQDVPLEEIIKYIYKEQR